MGRKPPVSLAGGWDWLPTKAMLLVRQTMLDEAAVLAYRDRYLAIALNSLLSLAMTLYLRTGLRRRRCSTDRAKTGPRDYDQRACPWPYRRIRAFPSRPGINTR